ncbi:gamma conglutin 1-like [Rutidosis leptorrhynchoides]|uniref:gamma conglutin 1-like n=2 Tax=Rutidosis leptorrhynchoides TaxID=125765 RepID=UPI003A99B2F4
MGSDVYSWVVRRVISVTKRVPRANVVAPFGVCYNISTGPVKIPNIDLVLQDGKTWTISTANSIKQVDNNVACLAFVDGGATSEHGILIGTYQIEDNFLMFNWKNSTLGFSSSLTLKKSSCSFHF